MSTAIPSPSRTIPQTKPVTLLNAIPFFHSLGGNFFDLIADGFRETGDLYQMTILGNPMVLIHHPDHLYELLVTRADDFHKSKDYTDGQKGLARFLGSGLLTSDGAFWKRQRKLAAPALHMKRIAAYGETMVSETAAMLDRWPTHGAIDVGHEMTQATLRIVTRTLFSLEIGADGERIGRIMSDMQEFIGATNTLETLIPAWVPTPRRFREQEAVRELDEIVYRVIADWKQHGEDRGDLLSMLLLARDEDGQPMSDRQARDEIVTMFLAGHETTANTLNWVWYLLAQHPEVEAKLHAEVDSVLGERVPTLDDLKRLPYAEQVVKEAMRLYPPAFGFSRLAVRDTELGGYPIPAGTEIQAFNYTTHRDPRWWTDPDTFRPERFAPEHAEPNTRYAYLPFGGGPRICIGIGFAQMEAHLMTALIAARYRLRLSPGQIVTPEPLLTLRPEGGHLPMIVERR